MVSDCWGAYTTLGDFCRHHAVNHSVEFVNSQGYHTNTAEGSHRIIKDWVRKQHYNFGATSLELMRNVALQCVKLGDVHNGRETAWQVRMANLFTCFLEYYGSDVDDFEDSVSLSSCPSDYMSEDDFVPNETDSVTMEDNFRFVSKVFECSFGINEYGAAKRHRFFPLIFSFFIFFSRLFH